MAKYKKDDALDVVILTEMHSPWSIQTDLGAIVLVHLGLIFIFFFSSFFFSFSKNKYHHIFRILVSNGTTHTGSGDITSYGNQPITEVKHNVLVAWWEATCLQSITVLGQCVSHSDAFCSHSVTNCFHLQSIHFKGDFIQSSLHTFTMVLGQPLFSSVWL